MILISKKLKYLKKGVLNDFKFRKFKIFKQRVV